MDLSYPIGKFDFHQTVAPGQYAALIQDIAGAPGLYRDAVRGLDDAQLDTPYRPGGWTVRQTVHHVADSHMNSYIRWRLALNCPTRAPRRWSYPCNSWKTCMPAGSGCWKP